MSGVVVPYATALCASEGWSRYPAVMASRLLTSAMWGVLVLGVAACRGCILPDRNLGRRVADSEIVGTWTMTPESLALLERDGFRRAPGQTFTMTFAGDGAAEFASVDELDQKHYVHLLGTWELLHDSSRGTSTRRTNELVLSLRARDGSHSESIDWGFDEVGGKLRLWSFLGDPDSWEFVEYTRDH
jgi:hypothetical protein